MVQLGKVPTANPNNLSSIPRTHTVEENSTPKLSFALHTHTHAQTAL